MTGALPETMTALRVHAVGEAPRAERVPVPQPGGGEVLVRLVASAIAHHDVGVVTGRMPARVSPPFVPGLEGAGRVAAAGAGVDEARLAPGTPVRVFAGGLPAGTWAEYVAAPARAVTPLPDGLDPTLAAACGSVVLTAWAALELGAPGPGEAVGVTGASGAVGSLVVQLAARRGAARIVAWVRSRERAAGLPPGVAVETDGQPAEPVDLLVDTVGGERLASRLRAVRPGGRAVLIGYAAGTRVCFELPELIAADVSLLPLNMMRRGVPREVQLGLLDDFAAGRLRVATEVVRVDELDAAIARLESGAASGRVVLRW